VIYFNFLDIEVEIRSDCAELLARLKNDFSQYAVPQQAHAPQLKVQSLLTTPSIEQFNLFKGPRLRTKNAAIRDNECLRLSDYHGEGWSIFDFDEQSAIVFSRKIERLHEITYLLILSRVGKYLDSKGLHRIHAMGVSTKERALLLLLPMSGGKTTLLSHLAQKAHASDLSILSDDSPLITLKGQTTAFAVRCGVTREQLTTAPFAGKTPAYSLERMRYGPKFLFPIEALGCPVSKQTFDTVALLLGKRTTLAEPSIKPVSKLKVIPALLSQLVIGIGLPIMREYFIENRPSDYLLLFKIAVNRLRAAFALLRRSQTYLLELSDDPSKNAALVASFLDLAYDKNK